MVRPHWPVSGGQIQERLQKFLKDGQLFGGKQVDIPFVIEEKGADADDGLGKITGTPDASFYLGSSSAQQESKRV